MGGGGMGGGAAGERATSPKHVAIMCLLMLHRDGDGWMSPLHVQLLIDQSPHLTDHDQVDPIFSTLLRENSDNDGGDVKE